MGILDDAIRQHLELKRRHGAPDSELQQMEDEAFGPPTRPGEPDFPESETTLEQAGNGVADRAETTIAESPAAPEAPTAPPPEAPPGEPEEAPPDEDGEPGDRAEPPEPPPVAEEEPATKHPVVETLPDDVPIESLETVEHPFPDEIVEPDADAADDEATPAEEKEEEREEPAWEPDEEQGAAGDREDVLADTPEFLRDTPEDDELWFEQGEPKDFDF
ncbi:MAG TPA: hypothetical protein VKG89_00690 [Solirubrobacterales bacterium]|nr:hypothetical protein [Solirubrobacterales bacterium]